MKRLTAFHIKLIAAVTMLIDHIGAAVIARVLSEAGQSGGDLMAVYRVMRIIGRVSFPLFCFLLVQGFVHTRSVEKYALRLFAFALISEMPFDLIFFRTVWYPGKNNVFFTLLFGVLVLWVVQHLLELKQHGKTGGMLCGVCIGCVYIAACSVMYGIIHSDYGMAGISAVLVMYLLRDKPAISYAAAVGTLAVIMSSPNTLYALVGFIPIVLYSGERGPGVKWLFYLFYPVHLLLLVPVCMMLRIY